LPITSLFYSIYPYFLFLKTKSITSIYHSPSSPYNCFSFSSSSLVDKSSKENVHTRGSTPTKEAKRKLTQIDVVCCLALHKISTKSFIIQPLIFQG